MKLGKIVEGLRDKSFPFSVRIACEGKEYIELDVFKEFQGKLKTRTETDIIKILKSIRGPSSSITII